MLREAAGRRTPPLHKAALFTDSGEGRDSIYKIFLSFRFRGPGAVHIGILNAQPRARNRTETVTGVPAPREGEQNLSLARALLSLSRALDGDSEAAPVRRTAGERGRRSMALFTEKHNPGPKTHKHRQSRRKRDRNSGQKSEADTIHSLVID